MDVIYNAFALLFLLISLFNKKQFKRFTSKKDGVLIGFLTNLFTVVNNLSLFILPIGIIAMEFQPKNSFYYVVVSIFDILLPNSLRIVGVIGLLLTLVSRRWLIKILERNFFSNLSNQEITKEGPYKFIRHPIYTTWIQQTIFMFIVLSNLLMIIPIFMLLISIILRIPVEENFMLGELGVDYSEYINSTKKLIPWIY